MRIEVLERDRSRVRAVDVVQRRPLACAQTNPLKVRVEIEHPGSLTAGVGHRLGARRDDDPNAAPRPKAELSRLYASGRDTPHFERRGSPRRVLGLLLLLGPQSTTRQCEYAAGATKLRVGWVDLAASDASSGTETKSSAWPRSSLISTRARSASASTTVPIVSAGQ